MKQPPWFKEFTKRLVARQYAGIGEKGLFNTGKLYGKTLCDLDKLREAYSKAQPTAKARKDFDKRRRWLAERVGKAAYMTKTDATEFLSGVLSGLKRERRRGEDAAFTEQVFRTDPAVLVCRTQREVADVVKSHLPPETWARWTSERKVYFYRNVQVFCNHVGFKPAKRGHPAKK